MDDHPWQLLPPAFLEQLKNIIPPKNLQGVLTSFCIQKPVSARINTIKTSAQFVKAELTNEQIPFTTVNWHPDAIVFGEVNRSIITNCDLVNNGLLYMQSLSSMIPALVLDPKPGENILDLTAAPGSKTTQIAAMMQNEGVIVANDKSRERLYKLRAILELQGVKNTEVVNLPGEFIWKKYPEHFDKTLVDAPCTMEGRFQCNDPKSYKDWKPKKVKLLSQLQKYLLRSAVSATKPGGLIVYSTCTLEPDENEAVVEWILKKEMGAVTIESIDIPGIETQEGIINWKNKKFDSQISKTLRILPSATMEGFYIAALRKHKSTILETIN